MRRNAETTDLDQLASLWHQGWHDAHAQIVPPELTAVRTLANFRERLEAGLADIRVIIADGRCAGFAMLRDDELYQFYVAAEARGKGIAAELMADAEAQLLERGVRTTWLSCAIGNDRAARFYEKSGWRRAGIIEYTMETSAGPFRMDVWRYEKKLDHPIDF
jgi:ribosomal protein S18 acetylase RimI-like enzyme